MKYQVDQQVRVQCVYSSPATARRIDGRRAIVTGLTNWHVQNGYRSEWYSLRFLDERKPATVKSVFDADLRPC